VLGASVIVPTYNRPAALDRTLAALRAMDYPADDFEIVVVDTGRQNAESERIAAAHGARWYRHDDLGVSAARNHGARMASGELLMFVDDDIVVGPENLRQHQAIHMEQERCLVSGHWEYEPEFRRRLERSPLGRWRLGYEDIYNHPHGVDPNLRSGRVNPKTLTGQNVSLKAAAFWMLDGFDERFPVGAEDQDLTWRAARAGFVLVYDYDIRIIHNDQHADFAALCRRQERGAVGMVYFTRKNPDVRVTPMIELNGPVRRGDSLRVVARKVSRSLLSRRLALAAAHRLVRMAESVRPNGGRPLEVLYRAVGGLHVFRGTRRGLRLTSTENWPPAHQAGSAERSNG
jgi:GT2 family glycosyltransferase